MLVQVRDYWILFHSWWAYMFIYNTWICSYGLNPIKLWVWFNGCGFCVWKRVNPIFVIIDRLIIEMSLRHQFFFHPIREKNAAIVALTSTEEQARCSVCFLIIRLTWRFQDHGNASRFRSFTVFCFCFCFICFRKFAIYKSVTNFCVELFESFWFICGSTVDIV